MIFVNVGFGNLVQVSKIISILNPDSAPIKRLIQESRDAGILLDATCGRRTRSVVVSESDHIILSAIQSETLYARMQGKEANDAEEAE
ncbi:DUF370 domain-containing protein [Cytobacillus sp. FJAT-54145]|uniref:Putative regulatory protein ACFYKX_09975 n=1 Tax=Cytobacillus spartinae TaxID=3299023 RepID=A0ABW6KDS4_9BACI